MPFSLGFWAAAGAGGGGADYELISSTILTGTSSAITFSSIPSTYKHLEIRAAIRADRAGAESEIVTYRFNGDTGTNYAAHVLLGNGGSVSSTAYTGETSMRGEAFPAASDTANAFGAVVLQVLDYASTSKNKTQRLLSGRYGASQYAVSVRSGVWLNTAAVSSISLQTFFGSSFVSGTRVSLYGVKG